MESKLSSLLIRTEPCKSACVGRTGATSRNVGNGKAGKLITRQRSVAIRVHSPTGRRDERKGFYNGALVFYYKKNGAQCKQPYMWKTQNKTW